MSSNSPAPATSQSPWRRQHQPVTRKTRYQDEPSIGGFRAQGKLVN